MLIATCLLWSQGSGHEEWEYTTSSVEGLLIATHVAGICTYLNWWKWTNIILEW